MKFAFSIVIVVLDPTSFKFSSDLILESDVEKVWLSVNMALLIIN